MPCPRLEQYPLDRLVATKLNEPDYQRLQKRVAEESSNQASLIRLVIRRYLYSSFQERSHP